LQRALGATRQFVRAHREPRVQDVGLEHCPHRMLWRGHPLTAMQRLRGRSSRGRLLAANEIAGVIEVEEVSVSCSWALREGIQGRVLKQKASTLLRHAEACRSPLLLRHVRGLIPIRQARLEPICDARLDGPEIFSGLLCGLRRKRWAL
jgi:hypothetical protein